MANDAPGVPKAAPVLITGANGFVGKNLRLNLAAAGYTNLLLYDVDTPEEQLADFAKQAAFVFHLAGVNRPKDAGEFYTGNADLTTRLLSLLAAAGSSAPVVLSSTAQAGNGSDYAKSKEAAEAAVFAHGAATGAPVYVYRLVGVFGKLCRPFYNNVVATFCHQIARGEPVEIRDANFELPLCYIDDVVADFMAALSGAKAAPAAGEFAAVGPEFRVTLGDLAEMLQSFYDSRATLEAPASGSGFIRRLYATYLSYLPEGAFGYNLKKNEDARGSFTEFLRFGAFGQVSVNVAKAGVVKGNHWHNTKNEKFLVVSGEGFIRFRHVTGGEVLEYPVKGEDMRVVDIPPGYTHNIENTGSADLVTLMWASECFDPDRPDTFFEEV